MNKELKRLLQEQREQDNYHQSMEDEFTFYRRVARGDTSIFIAPSYEDSEGMGKLSLNPVRNERYHTIILIAMITRFCIEAGLDSEEAYTLSDLYIRKIDEVNDISSITSIRNECVADFVNTMHNLQTVGIKNLQVKRANEYIQKNLTKPITSQDVGNAIGCNPDYLSRLFKKELGKTLGDYILDKKCNAACYMLENSNETITDIAIFLGFASASHFIERFKKCMGKSPTEHRKEAIFSKN